MKISRLFPVIALVAALSVGAAPDAVAQDTTQVQQDTMQMRMQQDTMRMQQDTMQMRMQQDTARVQMQLRSDTAGAAMQQDTMQMRMQQDTTQMRMQTPAPQQQPAVTPMPEEPAQEVTRTPMRVRKGS